MSTEYMYKVYDKNSEDKEPLNAVDTYAEARAYIDGCEAIRITVPTTAATIFVYGVDKYRMTDGIELRLGECVDGDLEPPMNCDVCDKDLWKGDGLYMTTDGQVNHEGNAEDNGDEHHTIACAECGEILSDAVGIARATIVKQRTT